MKRCGKCGAVWPEEGPLSFRAVCRNCFAELHACINCRLYESSAANRCRSRTTEWVRDPERANFCEEFEFREADPDSSYLRGADARRKLDKLFGDA